MSKSLGFSVYLSHFEKQKPVLEKLKGQSVPIFTSLHMSEEMSQDYVDRVEGMCHWLAERDFYIIADVSPVTLKKFDEQSLNTLAERLRLNNLRLDYGFDLDKIELDEALDLTFNASTVWQTDRQFSDTLYMHNFYPRPETGLEPDQFVRMNQSIRATSGILGAFISGDDEVRGPIYEGLPTLEAHRSQSPYAQYVDLVKRYDIDNIFVADVRLSSSEHDLIIAYMEDGLIRLPVTLSEESRYLYDQPFTVRVDSPSTLIRVQESREYAQPVRTVVASHTTARTRGSVTLDNEGYKRYSGEVQITKKDYPADERVNVIGKITDNYLLLLDNLSNGDRFMFVERNDQ